jgi:hypothetical protein
MEYIDLDLCSNTNIDIIEDIKNNNMLSQFQKIDQVKKHLFQQTNFAYPDFILEWTARAKLGCPFSQEELDLMKKSAKEKQEIINQQNAKAQLEMEEESKNKTIKGLQPQSA